MRKLKLETLHVESFETTAGAPRARGTVAAHSGPGGPHPLETYDVERCGVTRYFDCSLGCPSVAPCLTEICA